METFFDRMEATAPWKVAVNPVLKNELLIVSVKTEQIIARVNLADYDDDESAMSYAELLASAPTLRSALWKASKP